MTNLNFAGSTVELTAFGESKRLNIAAYHGGIMRPTVGSGADRSQKAVVVDISTMHAGNVEILMDHDRSKRLGSGQVATGEGVVMVAAELDMTSTNSIIVVDEHRNKTGKYRQASIGGSFDPEDVEEIQAHQTLIANGRTIVSDEPFLYIRNFRLNEVSVLHKGADDQSLTLAAKGTPMSTQTPTKTVTIPKQDETLQFVELLASADAQTLEPAEFKELRGQIVAGTIDLEAAGRRIQLSAKLGELEHKSGGRGNQAPHRVDGSNQMDTTKTLTCGLLLKAGLHDVAEKAYDERTLEAAGPISRMHNMEISTFALNAEGKQVPSNRNDLFASGTTTISLPTAMNDAMHKTLEHVFRQSPATWRSFANVKFATDFRNQTGLRPAMLGELEPLAKDGEIKHGGITEAVYTWSVDTFAKMVYVSRKDWINDTTNFLAELAPGLGRMAARKVSDLVYTAVLANAGSFFSAGNSNLGTGAGSALSVTSLSAAILAMVKQTDENGDSIDILPRTLVVPPELEDEAKTILKSRELDRTAAASDRAPKANPHEARLNLEVEPRLANTKFANASATGWYVFGMPQDNPITVGFLNNESPQLDYFDLNHEAAALRMGWRIYNDFGVAFAEHRAAYKADGT